MNVGQQQESSTLVTLVTILIGVVIINTKDGFVWNSVNLLLSTSTATERLYKKGIRISAFGV